MSALLRLLLALLLPACDPTDPGSPELVPTLALRCAHPELWFEGIYPDADSLRSFPAERPHRPAALATQLPTAAWDGPTGPAAQTACADVCVGAAQPGFFHHCPDTGWQVVPEPGLAPPPPEFPAELAALLDPDACFPDSLCADAFAAPPGAHLRAPAGTLAPGQAQADHLGALLYPATLDLKLPGAHLAHPLHGRAEYSAGACTAERCPFYLASLSLDDRGAHSRASPDASTSLRGLRLELLRPTLGLYTPATGALELPAGALDLRIRLDLREGERRGPGRHELRLRNPMPVRGRYHAGALHLALELALPGSSFARLDLEFAPLAHPPVATFAPPVRLDAAGPAGLPLPHDPGERSALHAAHDPDGDLASLHWVVDGVPGARHIPPGEHEVALWVADRRGALARSPLRTIMIHAAP